MVRIAAVRGLINRPEQKKSPMNRAERRAAARTKARVQRNEQTQIRQQKRQQQERQRRQAYEMERQRRREDRIARRAEQNRSGIFTDAQERRFQNFRISNTPDKETRRRIYKNMSDDERREVGRRYESIWERYDERQDIDSVTDEEIMSPAARWGGDDIEIDFL